VTEGRNITLEIDEDFTVDIDASQLDDSGRQAYETLEKEFRKAYLQKTDKLAKQRDEWQRQLNEDARKYQSLEEKYNTVAQENQQFHTWWQTEGQYLYRTPQEGAAAEGFEQPDATAKEVARLNRAMQAAQQRYDEAFVKMQEKLGTHEQALRMQHELFELRLKHPDADPQRIVETARDRGITNLDLAYQIAYGDDDMKRQLEEKEAKLKEDYERKLQDELDKFKAEGKLIEPRPASMRYAPPEVATSYAQASQGLLNTVRSKGGGILTD
jgi:hypothetical protein